MKNALHPGPEASARVRPRLAGLLTLLSPLVGLLYLGRPRLALLAQSLVLGWQALLWLGPTSAGTVAATFGLGLAGGLLTPLGFAIWAVAQARRHPWVPRRPWRRWYALVAAGVAAILLSPGTWLGQPFSSHTIPAESMAPAVVPGDWLVAESPRRPFAAAPKPGDLVIFPLPRDPSQTYGKRLIGVAGDEIQMRGGVLHVNGAPVRRERLPDWVPPPRPAAPGPAPLQAWRETLPNGSSYVVVEQGDYGPLDNTAAYRVPLVRSSSWATPGTTRWTAASCVPSASCRPTASRAGSCSSPGRPAASARSTDGSG